MPNVQYVNPDQYDTPNRAEENLKSFFSNLDKQYKEKRDKDTLGNLLSEYQKTERTSNDLEDLFFKMETENISPSKRVEFLKNYGEMSKVNANKQKALKSSVTDKLDDYDKQRMIQGGKETTELEKKIPQYANTLADIDEMERLSKEELNKGWGYAKGWTGTQSARELDTLGASALDPVIKKFNPAGTLPTAKLNWIRNTFAPKAAENPSGRQGKINNLRRFTKQAQKKDIERLELLKQYKGLIPTEVLKKFEESEQAEYEALTDELSFEDKIKDKKDDETISGFYDLSGEKLAPIPKKEAVELFKQGLITNVPKD